MHAKISQRVVHYCGVSYKMGINYSKIKNILNRKTNIYLAQ